MDQSRDKEITSTEPFFKLDHDIPIPNAPISAAVLTKLPILPNSLGSVDIHPFHNRVGADSTEERLARGWRISYKLLWEVGHGYS